VGVREILKMVFVLLAICILAAMGLGFIYTKTKPKIREQEEEASRRALGWVLPGAEKFVGKKLPGMEYEEGYDAEGKLVGYAFNGRAQGYSSTIVVKVGISPGGEILAVKILQQQETPGLGTKAVDVPTDETLWGRLAGKRAGKGLTEPPFQSQFRGKGMGDLALVRGQWPPPHPHHIDAITGATITSAAVTDAVKDAIELFMKEKKSGGDAGAH
jgi:Na+-translocating ferredoxin:NAD+ oxidoreductase subunit G